VACCCGPSCEPTLDQITLTISNVNASDANIFCKFPGLFAAMPGTYILSKPPYGQQSPSTGEISGPCSRTYEYSGAFYVIVQATPGAVSAFIQLFANASPSCGGANDLWLGSNGEGFISKETGKSRWPEISAGSMTSPARTERLFARFFSNGFRLDIGSIDLVLSS